MSTVIINDRDVEKIRVFSPTVKSQNSNQDILPREFQHQLTAICTTKK